MNNATDRKTGRSALHPGGTNAGEPLRVAIVSTHPIQCCTLHHADPTRTGRFDVTALYLSGFSLRGGDGRGGGRPVAWGADLLAGYTASFMGKAGRRRMRSCWYRRTSRWGSQFSRRCARGCRSCCARRSEVRFAPRPQRYMQSESWR